MSDRYRDLPALEELGRRLTAVSEELGPDIAPERPTTRRWRRWVAVAVPAAAVVAGAAGAATLLSTGEPVQEQPGKAQRYQPTASGRVLDVSAPDPRGAATWGAETYTSRSGQSCVVAGQVRGNQLGVIGSDERFHPYAAAVSGPCADLGELKLVSDLRYVAEADRTILYGRARLPAEEVVATTAGERMAARVGHNGAFLFVFEGKLDVRGLRLERR